MMASRCSWLSMLGVIDMSDPTAGDVFRLGVRAKSLGFRLIDYPTIYLLWRIDESVPDYATQSGTAAEDVAEIVDEIERRPRYRLHLAGNPSVSTSQLVNGFVTVTDNRSGDSFTLWPGECARALEVCAQNPPRIGNWQPVTD